MRIIISILIIVLMLGCTITTHHPDNDINQKIDSLLALMTIEEKIGQMVQVNFGDLDSLIKKGSVGSVLNVVDVDEINRLQKIAIEESRLGIPILFARDVVHGFKTILPIPLGQAATWNTELIEKGARIAAIEARSSGIRWTFAPMVDVSRDPRWGRIAESFGEDTYLTSLLGVSMIRGFQGEDLKNKFSLLACPKHFAAYGAVEAGRDYFTVTLPENEFRDVYIPPFKSSINAGALTIMAGFNELNGIPVSGNNLLTNQVLREEWDFKGFVVSDWGSIDQLTMHGYTKDSEEAAEKAVNAGIDMEMASSCYSDHLNELVDQGNISIETIDKAVSRILWVKFKIGLFDSPYTIKEDYPKVLNKEHLNVAKEIAKQSLVLLKNKNNILPLNPELSKVAVIGPLADTPHEQLGTWIFDGNKKDAITPYKAISDFLGKDKVHFAKGMEISRTMSRKGFPAAIAAARKSDVILLFLGEESILSGEAHCRADIGLPGLQNELIKELSKTDKPIISIIMAGRPLTFEDYLKHFDALIYAWHPGTMGGPAIKDIIFGIESPSGKLPITFPRVVGQIPIYYSQKNSGKPATTKTWERMYDIPVEAVQYSLGNTNHYLDYGFEPLYPFGYGLSYTTFDYKNIQSSSDSYKYGDSIKISATITNTGSVKAEEVTQFYIRDLVGSRTRPVRQLKGFKRIELMPGESQVVEFKLHTSNLAFYNQEMKLVTEPGEFQAWIGGSSKADLMIGFRIEDREKVK